MFPIRSGQRLLTALLCVAACLPLRASGQLDELEAAVGRLPAAELHVSDELLEIQRNASNQQQVQDLWNRLQEQLKQQLTPEQIGRLVQRHNVLDYTAKLRAYENEIGRVRGSVAFGTTGDSTSSQDQFKATAGIDLNVGTYPSQLRVLTRADVRNTNGELSEDVSTFLVNFDHYFVKKLEGGIPPCRETEEVDSRDARRAQRAEARSAVRRQLETYAFIERFSDSFMSIDRRFEVGGGVKLEWHSGLLTDKGCGALGTLERLRAQHAEVEVAFNELAGIDDPKDPNAFASLYPQSILHNRAAFARNQYSKWEIGLAFSVFRESERPADITAAVLDINGNPLIDEDENAITRKLAPPTTNGERLTVRPSLIWRPRDDFKVTTMYYYKAKLGADSRVEGVRDVRRDVSIAAEWAVGELTKARGQPTIVLALEEHEDSVPPNLVSFIPSELPAGGAAFVPVSAEREHRQVRLEVKVSF